jgi:hypothetical protein
LTDLFIPLVLLLQFCKPYADNTWLRSFACFNLQRWNLVFKCDLLRISQSNLPPTLEICALRPSFLNKFTLIWHLAFAPCAQLLVLSPRFLVRSTLYALCPTFMKFTPDMKKLL